MTDTIEAAPPPRSVEEVKAMLESTEKGGVRNSIHNCLTVFQYDPELSGAVAKNLLTERVDLLRPIGRQRRAGGRALTDTDMKYIRLYLEDTYGLTSEKKIADALDLAADANRYHPIRDYLNGLVGRAGANPFLPAALFGGRHGRVHLPIPAAVPAGGHPPGLPPRLQV